MQTSSSRKEIGASLGRAGRPQEEGWTRLCNTTAVADVAGGFENVSPDGEESGSDRCLSSLAAAAAARRLGVIDEQVRQDGFSGGSTHLGRKLRGP